MCRNSLGPCALDFGPSTPGGVCFRCGKPPSAAELDALFYRISERIGRYLERQGLLERDMENSYLTLESQVLGIVATYYAHEGLTGPRQAPPGHPLDLRSGCYWLQIIQRF